LCDKYVDFVIFDKENLSFKPRMDFRLRLIGERILRLFANFDGELEPKCASSAKLATEAHVTRHQKHQIAANRQAQAGASILSARRSVGLREAVENRLLSVVGDSDAGVSDFESQPVVCVGC